MQSIRYLDMKNLRDIQSLQINNIKRINIFVGRNGCGKTTILEALNYLFCDDNDKYKKDFQDSTKIYTLGDGDRKQNVRFIKSNDVLSVDVLYDNLVKIKARNELNQILEVLKEIDPDIKDIEMFPKDTFHSYRSNTVFINKGYNTLIPITEYSYGIYRLLYILCTILDSKDGIVLIDEITSGLHFRSVHLLWEAILKIIINNNVQLFVTTHSWECLEYAVGVISEITGVSKNELISVYRIYKKDKQHGCAHNKYEILKCGLENNIEIR